MYIIVLVILIVVYYLTMYEPHKPLETQKVQNIKMSLKSIIPPDHFDRIKVYDMEEKYGQDVAYTKQKTKIWMCTKSKEGIPEEKDALTYVLIHEYAHAINFNSYQHDAEFQKTFKELLHKADINGIKYRQKDTICGRCLTGSCKLKKYVKGSSIW